MLFFLQLYVNNIHFNLTEVLQTTFYSLRLDLSTASYLVAVPFLIVVAYQFSGKPIFKKIIRIYHYFFIPFCTLLLIANIKIYESWGTILNRRAVAFAADPREMMASLTGLQLILISGFLVLFSFLLIFSFNHFIIKYFPLPKERFWHKTFILLISAGIIFLGIRGGWQLIPINESAAYFSSRTVLNHVATNPLWHLANNISKSTETDHNPFQQMTDETGRILIDELYKTELINDIRVINPALKPNIVLIMLESWTADIIEPLEGDKTITPFFSSLCDSGLLFSNIYATGRRTDQALPSLLSGFPAQPDHSIIRNTDKTERLPYFTQYFKKNGYDLSFFYGGELGFANMHAYLLYAGFEHFVSKDDFPSATMNSKWGAHDEFVLSKQITELKKTKQPFFSLLVTLSSHEPYEIPRPDFIKGNDTPSKFRNAIRYTDECLKEYFSEASKQSWYNNTLFILVADHGHIQPKQRDYYDMLTHHIPLLFYGPALNTTWCGKKIGNVGNQNDLPATLLHQFNADSHAFIWSNDLLNDKRKNFAYADFDESLGWVTDYGSFIYNSSNKRVEKITGREPDTISIREAVAYRQLLYKEFLELGNK